MARVDWADLELAVELVSGDSLDAVAYVSRETGRIFMESGATGPDEDMPDDVDDTYKYAVVPSKRDLDLGQNVAFEFVRRHHPADLGQVDAIFQRRGAFRVFKQWLAGKNELEAWFAFETNVTREALASWCADNGLEFEP